MPPPEIILEDALARWPAPPSVVAELREILARTQQASQEAVAAAGPQIDARAAQAAETAIAPLVQEVEQALPEVRQLHQDVQADSGAVADHRALVDASLSDWRSRWLGDHPAPPAGPQIDGALYYDSTALAMYVWRSGAWQPMATGMTATDILNALGNSVLRSAAVSAMWRIMLKADLVLPVTIPVGDSHLPLRISHAHPDVGLSSSNRFTGIGTNELKMSYTAEYALPTGVSSLLFDPTLYRTSTVHRTNTNINGFWVRNSSGAAIEWGPAGRFVGRLVVETTFTP